MLNHLKLKIREVSEFIHMHIMRWTMVTVLLVSGVASAQIVQPTFVRPSKSKVQQLFNVSQSVALTQNSVVIDSSTFYSIQLQIDFADTTMACASGVNLIVETSDNSAGPWLEAQDSGNNFAAAAFNGDSSTTVSGLSAFTRVNLGTSIGGVCSGNVSISAVMLPNPVTQKVQGAAHDLFTSNLGGRPDYFPVIVGGVFRSGSFELPSSINLSTWNTGLGYSSYPFLNVRSMPVPDANLAENTGVLQVGTTATIVPQSGRGTALVLQNRSAIPVNCGFTGTVTRPAVDTIYSFTLPAETGGNKGSSAPYTIDGFNGSVWCAADVANTPVSWYRR